LEQHPPQLQKPDWLTERDLEQITIGCLRIESGRHKKNWLPSLFDVYAALYLSARAPHGEQALLEDLPVLVHEKALERRWIEIPRTRPRRVVRGVFEGFATGHLEHPSDPIPASEYTEKIGTRMVPPSYFRSVMVALSPRIRHWQAELAEKLLRDAKAGPINVPVAQALLGSDLTRAPGPSMNSLLPDCVRKSPEAKPVPGKNYSSRDAQVYKIIGRDPLLTMTNNEIAKSYRSALQKLFPRIGSESLRACLNRIRRYQSLESSEDVRKKRSAKAKVQSQVERSSRKKSGQ
jgi:hypothetical protein